MYKEVIYSVDQWFSQINKHQSDMLKSEFWKAWYNQNLPITNSRLLTNTLRVLQETERDVVSLCQTVTHYQSVLGTTIVFDIYPIISLRSTTKESVKKYFEYVLAREFRRSKLSEIEFKLTFNKRTKSYGLKLFFEKKELSKATIQESLECYAVEHLKRFGKEINEGIWVGSLP